MTEQLRSADVLVIGAGFAGLWAAYRAVELGASVILVEKGFVSRAGASVISGGVTTYPRDDDDLDEWVREVTVHGGYMNDQIWTRRAFEGQVERIKDFIDWDIPITRDENGEIKRIASRGMFNVRALQYRPKVAVDELTRRIVEAGVQIVNRVAISELLTSDGALPTKGQVIGAVGLDVRSGDACIFSAKRVILSTGLMATKGVHKVDNDCGDGAAMAYRAGARLIDLEFSFGGTYDIVMGQFNFGSYNVAVGNGARLINRLGERFMERYDPERLERSEQSTYVGAFVQEIRQGRGPVKIDLRDMDPLYWDALRTTQIKNILVSDLVPDPKTTPLLIEPYWGIWNGGHGGIDIDYECRSSIPGLYAAGSAAKVYPAGLHGSAGLPTGFAMTSGYVAGESAAREALDNDAVDEERAKAVARDFFARSQEAMATVPSPVTPDMLHDKIVSLESSVMDTMILNDEKLGRWIDTIDEVLADTERCKVDSAHELSKLEEARSLAQCMKLIYVAARNRTESRGHFYREDYPVTEDPDWLCWHAVERQEAGPVAFKKPIPFDDYAIKPPPPVDTTSQLARIFRGDFEPVTSKSMAPS